LGLTNVGITGFVMGKFPEWMPAIYTIKAIVFIALRIYMFRRQKMHYYLFDFCYFANLLTFLYLHVFPQNETLFLICFSFSVGPLAWAIIAWRNSLVLHSLSRTTSVFIHITPGLVLYSIMWLADDPATQTKYNTMRGKTPSFVQVSLLPLLPYLCWQVFYFIKVEIFSSQKVAVREYETSFRALSTGKGMIGNLIRSFSSNSQRLLAFMTFQFAYTFVTMLPALLLFVSFWSHTVFLITMTVACAWNGANWYFEVFAEKYGPEMHELEQQRLEKKKEKDTKKP